MMAWVLPIKERWCIKFRLSMGGWSILGALADAQGWWEECTFATEAEATAAAERYNIKEGSKDNIPVRFI